MNRKVPLAVVASVGLIGAVLLGSLAVSVYSLAQLERLSSVPATLGHAWFSVPLLAEIFLAGFLVAVVLYGWRWARLALLIALLLWLPDLSPSLTKARGELQNPHGHWYAWFAVAAYASALALLLSKSARAHFKSVPSAGTSEA